MSRSPLSLALLHRPTIIAMGVITLAAACDREGPTDASRPAVGSSITPSRSIGLPGDEKPMPGYEIKTFGIESRLNHMIIDASRSMHSQIAVTAASSNEPRQASPVDMNGDSTTSPSNVRRYGR